MAKGQEPSSPLPFIQRHAFAVLASAALVCILILAGTAFFVLGPADKPDQFGPVATKGALDRPVTTPIKSTPLSETTVNKSGSRKVSPVKNGREQGFLANPPENIDMNKALKEAQARLEAGEIGKGETSDAQPAVSEPAPPTEPAKTESPPPNIAVSEAPNNADPDKPAEPLAGDVEQPPAVPAETVPDPPQPSGDSADAVVANPAPPKLEFTEAQLAKPFQDMPRAADLGDINNTEPTQLGKIYVPANILIACELISGREISRSKLFFELERSPTDKQLWFVNYIKRKNAQPEKMGSFFRKDDTFNFQWEPTAAENDNFNYLRNCVIKLTGQDQSTQFVNLRTAIPIEGLCITADQGLARVESSLEWLPNLDNLIVEVDLPSYAGVPKLYPIPTTRRVSKKQPVNLVFSESAKDNYIYLQVSYDLRKSIRLELSLLFDLGNGNTQTIDEKFLNQIVAQSSSFADTTALRSQQAETEVRPPDIKADDFDKWKSELKKKAELALSGKNSALNYSETIPKLYGKQIPLRVFFQLDNHEIVLAQSFEN